MKEVTLGWVSLSNSTEVIEVRGTIFLVFVVGGVLLRHRGGKNRWKWEQIKGLLWISKVHHLSAYSQLTVQYMFSL